MNLRNYLLVDDHYNSKDLYYSHQVDMFLFFEYNFKNLAKIVIVKIKNIHIWMFVKTTNDNMTFLGLIISTILDSNVILISLI